MTKSNPSKTPKDSQIQMPGQFHTFGMFFLHFIYCQCVVFAQFNLVLSLNFNFTSLELNSGKLHKVPLNFSINSTEFTISDWSPNGVNFPPNDSHWSILDWLFMHLCTKLWPVKNVQLRENIQERFVKILSTILHQYNPKAEGKTPHKKMTAVTEKSKRSSV